jgi:signal peptidase I
MKRLLEVPPFSWWCQHRARKRGREVAKHVRRLLATHRDIMESDKIKAVEKAMAEFDAARRGTIAEIEQGMDRLDRACAKLFPAPKHAQWREVIEIGLVAAVVAWGGIRTFFLQPFKIPTGSMQPTLYGVHIERLRPGEKMPILPQRLLELALCGRSYTEAVCEEDGELTGLTSASFKIGPFEFPRTVLHVGNREYTVSMDFGLDEPNSWTRESRKAKVMNEVGLEFGMKYRAGEPIIRCITNNGDHIFVDKVSYNFRRPRRGEIFVFETRGMRDTSGEFYIKRLGGVGGDVLQIKEPELFVNGQRAAEPGFARVMTLKDGYRGYSNPPGALYLGVPDNTYEVPRESYFALGDNSFNSQDSRYVGVVPHGNLVGKALFLYWPVTRRFGLTN